MPRDIVTKVSRERVRILGLPDIKERLKALGSEGVGNSPNEALIRRVPGHCKK